MKTKKIFEGNTTQIALDKALDELNLSEFDVEYEIIQTAKSGFLGIGKALAKIEVTYDDGKKEPKKEVKKAIKEEVKDTKKQDNNSIKEIKKEVKSENKTCAKDDKNTQEKSESVSVNLEDAAKIKAFLSDLLKEMKMDASVEMFTKGDSVRFNLVGDSMGIIIGKHGETLNAIQYLTKIYANRISTERIRISVDTENYRKKRAKNLEFMASKAYKSVISTGRDYAMPPLSAYERRIVHEYLQDKAGIKTFSVGEEPNRRLTISKI